LGKDFTLSYYWLCEDTLAQIHWFFQRN
jgi:hypothetical protein